MRIVAATRHRNVCQAAIDELLSPLLGVHMDEHAVSSLSPAAVARHRVAMIEMRILPNVERDRAARVETDSEVSTLVDPFDGAQLPVGDTLISIRGGETQPVAFTLPSLYPSV